MKKGRTMIPLLAGILVGALLVGPVAGAVEDFLKATPSVQKFYVDGQQVEMEAYAIEGYNYVKLRDIGRMVGFDVSYDAATDSALITTGMAYVDDEASAPVPAPQPIEAADYAAQANPAIFTGNYTRGMYNAMREAVTHRDAIAAGTFQNVSMGAVDTISAMRVAVKLSGGATYYSVVNSIDGSTKYISAEHKADCDAAIAHIRPFLDGISSLSEREQVRQMVWYIADRITYSTKIKAQPAQILAQDEVMEGAGSCMTYSSSLQFLCEQAGIPCILVTSYNHQWNMVYVDGKWWNVDPTTDNMNLKTARSAEDLQEWRDSTAVFYDIIGEVPYADGTVRINATYVDQNPQVTQFLKELLVPGSTK